MPSSIFFVFNYLLRSGHMQGTIRSITGGDVETEKIGAQHYRKKSCYILQDDELEPLFTTDEIMSMAADLKVGSSLSPKAKRMLVRVVVKEISDYKDNLGS